MCLTLFDQEATKIDKFKLVEINENDPSIFDLILRIKQWSSDLYDSEGKTLEELKFIVQEAIKNQTLLLEQ